MAEESKTKDELRKLCWHCKGLLLIRNPKGFCDHLKYPDYCDTCKTRQPPEDRLEVYNSDSVGQGFMEKAVDVYKAQPNRAFEIILLSTALPSYVLFFWFGDWRVTLTPIVVFVLILVVSLAGGKKE